MDRYNPIPSLEALVPFWKGRKSEVPQETEAIFGSQDIEVWVFRNGPDAELLINADELNAKTDVVCSILLELGLKKFKGGRAAPGLGETLKKQETPRLKAFHCSQAVVF